MNITVFGAGYVGLTSAVIFANSGFKVTLVEVNPTRLKILQSGKSFFYEAGVNELLTKAINDNNILITDDSTTLLQQSEVIFSCVGTPDNPDGSSNLQYVFDVVDTVAKYAKEGSIFVQKSTVPVGTGQKIEHIFKAKKRSINYASNPEFLREGTAIHDSLWFDRIVVGSNNKVAATKIIKIYKNMEQHRNNLTEITQTGKDPTANGLYISTNRNSAELTKVTANAFLALKISFANSIAKLADASDADVIEVMDAIGSDRRIGRAFLNAGRGYGGGCFPKDVSGLISSAEEYGVDMQILSAATDVNESMPGYIANKVKNTLNGLDGKKIAVLGLAFKSGTSDARKSPGVKIANILSKAGAQVSTYDPHAAEEAEEDLRDNVVVVQSMNTAVKDSDAIFITVDWPEFKNLDMTSVKNAMHGRVIVDAVNIFEPNKIKMLGLEYIGVGRK